MGGLGTFPVPLGARRGSAPPADAKRDQLLDADGDAVMNQMTSGRSAIAQAIDLVLSLFLGEWFLDQSLGVDYWGEWFKKGANVAELRAKTAAKIAAVPGVTHVTAVAFTYDSAARSAVLSYRVDSDVGIINGKVSP